MLYDFFPFWWILTLAVFVWGCGLGDDTLLSQKSHTFPFLDAVDTFLLFRTPCGRSTFCFFGSDLAPNAVGIIHQHPTKPPKLSHNAPRALTPKRDGTDQSKRRSIDAQLSQPSNYDEARGITAAPYTIINHTATQAISLSTWFCLDWIGLDCTVGPRGFFFTGCGKIFFE